MIRVFLLLTLLSFNQFTFDLLFQRLISLTEPTTTRFNFDWFKLCPGDEEFSVLLPVQPTVTIESSGYTYKKGGERVLNHRAYSGYIEDFGFAIESYLAANPERLFIQMYEPFKAMPMISEQKESGLIRRRYLRPVESGVGELQVVTTAHHIYVLTAASREDGRNLSKFISSFTPEHCDGPPADLTVNNGSNRYVATTEDSYAQKEVDQKALVVFKPKPQYTLEARLRKETGVVVLKGILSSTGKVEVLEVVKRLNYGLTEEAISAAKNFVFLPAKKDGRSVSVRMTLEFRFNLY
jgi:TonB family protein